MNPPVIEARGLTLHAAGRELVADLDWRARIGERWCVIGRNAVGKSTLLRALAGLSVPARAGHVEWTGREQSAWAMADAAAVRAFAPQQANDRFPIAVRRLLELAVCVPRDAALAALLRALDVEVLASRNVMQLSGGERQRVALAQCAVQGAPLLLLDEPVAFQDPAHQLQIARWLASLNDRCLVVSCARCELDCGRRNARACAARRWTLGGRTGRADARRRAARGNLRVSLAAGRWRVAHGGLKLDSAVDRLLPWAAPHDR